MGHWYQQDGDPKYTILGQNKKERDTTLSDARKLHLLPSVTTILAVVAKPGLDRWKTEQILDAVLESGLSLAGRDIEKWKGMILSQSQQVGKNAAARGSSIHNALEKYYKTGEIDHQEKDYIIPVIEELRKLFPNTPWEAEVSFASTMGFGGKIDLSSKGEKIILDFKTKKDKAFGKELQYDEHVMKILVGVYVA